MKTSNSKALLGCLLLTAALVSGCGSSSNNSIPSTATIFFAHSAFNNHSTLMVTGNNAFGQLGIGNLNTQSAAIPVTSIGKISGVAPGGVHTIAYKFDSYSAVYTWGSNYHGQLGAGGIATTGLQAYSNVPVRVPLHNFNENALTAGVVSGVSAGWYHSLAIVDGTVFSWGYNGYGQLGARSGESSLGDSNLPKQVLSNASELTNIVEVSAGAVHSLARAVDGRVWAWGDNSYGELGVDPAQPAVPNNPYVTEPQLVPITNVKQIAGGGSTSYALKTDGTVWAWGYNGLGQLGQDPNTPFTGTTTGLFSFTPVPIPLPAGKKAVAISAGWDHALALLDDGTVIGWGFNEYGQLGNNTTGPSAQIKYNYIPVTAYVTPATSTPLSAVTQIIAFGNQSLALSGNYPGTWYGWGDNGNGQLGNPIATNATGFIPSPVTVKGF